MAGSDDTPEDTPKPGIPPLGHNQTLDAANEVVMQHHKVHMDFVAQIASGATVGAGVLGIQIHQPLPRTHAIYALVGRVASEWARFEGILDAIIWDLLKVPGPTGACVTAQIMSSGPRLISIKALLLERGLFSNFDKEWGKTSELTAGLQVKRNRAVHDPWFLEKLSQTTSQQKSKPKDEKFVYGLVPYDIKKLRKLLADVIRLNRWAGKFRMKIQKHIE